MSHLGTQKATRDATRFLRFPRNRPIIYLVRHCVERFSLDCRKTKTKVNTLANQRA